MFFLHVAKQTLVTSTRAQARERCGWRDRKMLGVQPASEWDWLPQTEKTRSEGPWWANSCSCSRAWLPSPPPQARHRPWHLHLPVHPQQHSRRRVQHCKPSIQTSPQAFKPVLASFWSQFQYFKFQLESSHPTRCIFESKAKQGKGRSGEPRKLPANSNNDNNKNNNNTNSASANSTRFLVSTASLVCRGRGKVCLL